MNELCIRCGKPTPYDIETPIAHRLYFIEGSGQLCSECFRAVYGSPMPPMPMHGTDGTTTDWHAHSSTHDAHNNKHYD